VIRRFLLLLALIAFAQPLSAQEPNLGQLRAAERLVAVMRLESNWAPIQEQVIRQIHRTLPDTSRYAGEAERNMRETFKSFTWEKVGPEYVRLYASLYTEEELRQLTAFYESPVGQKSIRIQPEVAARTFDMVRLLMAQPATQ
jgi:hypothetical protein